MTISIRTYNQSGEPYIAPVALGVFGDDPVVAHHEGENLLIAWNERDSYGSTDVFVQTVSLEDFLQSNPVLVNSYQQGRQEVTSVTALSNGGWFVLWSSFDQDGSDYGVYGRFVNADGSVIGDEFRVNTDVAGSQEGAAAVQVPGVGLVVAWSSPDSSTTTLNTKVISEIDGSTISEKQIPAVFDARDQLGIDILPDGKALITWGIYSNGVKGVLFDAETNTSSDVFTLSQQGRGAFGGTIDDDGSVILTWAEDGFDGDGSGIQTALLRKEREAQTSPFPGRTYPMDSVTGMPSAV